MTKKQAVNLDTALKAFEKSTIDAASKVINNPNSILGKPKDYMQNTITLKDTKENPQDSQSKVLDKV